jgi:hypothetical protein
MALIISSSNKQATSHAEAEPFEAKVCDHSLTKVSPLQVQDRPNSMAMLQSCWLHFEVGLATSTMIE